MIPVTLRKYLQSEHTTVKNAVLFTAKRLIAVVPIRVGLREGVAQQLEFPQ